MTSAIRCGSAERSYTEGDVSAVLTLCGLKADWLKAVARITLLLQDKLPSNEAHRRQLLYFDSKVPALKLPGSNSLEKAGWLCRLLQSFRSSWPEDLPGGMGFRATPLAWILCSGDLIIDYVGEVLDAVSVMDEGDVAVLGLFREVCFWAETRLRFDPALLKEINESYPRRSDGVGPLSDDKRKILAAADLGRGSTQMLQRFRAALCFRRAVQANFSRRLLIGIDERQATDPSPPADEHEAREIERASGAKTLIYLVIAVTPNNFSDGLVLQAEAILLTLAKEVFSGRSVVYWRFEGEEHGITNRRQVMMSLNRARSSFRQLQSLWHHEHLEELFKGEAGPYVMGVAENVRKARRRIEQLAEEEEATRKVLFVLTDEAVPGDGFPEDVDVFTITLGEGNQLDLRRC